MPSLTTTLESSNNNKFEEEALAAEITGLRSEMVMYMQQIFQTENYALTAAVLSFSYALATDNPDRFAAIIFSFAPFVILFLAFDRIKKTRHRISRLGMYIYLREEALPEGKGWEHFVYGFRAIDISEISEALSQPLFHHSENSMKFPSDPKTISKAISILRKESEAENRHSYMSKRARKLRRFLSSTDRSYSESANSTIVSQPVRSGCLGWLAMKLKCFKRKQTRSLHLSRRDRSDILVELVELVDEYPGEYTGSLKNRWRTIIQFSFLLSTLMALDTLSADKAEAMSPHARCVTVNVRSEEVHFCAHRINPAKLPQTPATRL